MNKTLKKQISILEKKVVKAIKKAEAIEAQRGVEARDAFCLQVLPALYNEAVAFKKKHPELPELPIITCLPSLNFIETKQGRN
jgi:hypothetical protein